MLGPCQQQQAGKGPETPLKLASGNFSSVKPVQEPKCLLFFRSQPWLCTTAQRSASTKSTLKIDGQNPEVVPQTGKGPQFIPPLHSCTQHAQHCQRSVQPPFLSHCSLLVLRRQQQSAEKQGTVTCSHHSHALLCRQSICSQTALLIWSSLCHHEIANKLKFCI